MKKERAPNLNQARIKYLQMCKMSKVKPEPLDGLTNKDLFRLGEDLWNKLPTKTKKRYLEDKGLIPRSNPLAFKWFIRDGLRILQGWRLVWFVVTSPVRYLIFRGRNA